MTNRFMKYWILDDEHRPIEADLMTWGRWFEDFNNRLVDYTEITSQLHVSTVFLGVDHQFNKGPPILFETMVFGADRDAQDMWRYASWDDAKTGHAAIVRRLRTKQGIKVKP